MIQRIRQTAVEQFDRGLDFAMITIMSVCGAFPGSAGTRLLVLNEGTVVGHIGSEACNARVRDLALRAITTRSSHRARVLFRGGDTEAAEPSCSGEADVLIEFMDHSDPMLQRFVRGVHTIGTENRAAYVITEVSLAEGEWSQHSMRHALMDKGDLRVGGFPGCLQLIEALHVRDGLKAAQLVELGGWEFPVFLEWISPPGTACGTVQG
ncbi:MAG: XdhC family protein [Thermodesulfobacteriota bacterium]